MTLTSFHGTPPVRLSKEEQSQVATEFHLLIGTDLVYSDAAAFCEAKGLPIESVLAWHRELLREPLTEKLVKLQTQVCY